MLKLSKISGTISYLAYSSLFTINVIYLHALMSNTIVCQYKIENEMDGHLLPTGSLIKKPDENK